MPRIRLDLKYNGSGFCGWATQPDRRTVQAELELALSKIIPNMWGKPVPTIVGGRTDTGVHAKGQVVHFDIDQTNYAMLLRSARGDASAMSTESTISTNAGETITATTPTKRNAVCKRILYKLSCILPQDIVVYNCSITHSEFSARFWAKKRIYKYRIADNLRFYDPNRDDVWVSKMRLDVRKMNHSVRDFRGLHDFSAFAKPRKGATSVRNLQKFKFRKVRFGHDAGLIVATLVADAFAYNMVRSLVGAAVLVGSGKRDIRWMFECLESGVRQGATGPIAANGLTLERIKYAHHSSLAKNREKRIKIRRI